MFLCIFCNGHLFERKQQKLKPLLRQVNLLNRMIKKLLKISAFIFPNNKDTIDN